MLGGSLGGLFGGGTDHGAEDRMKAIQDAYANVNNVNFDLSSLTPEQKAAVGQLSPEQLQALEMPSAQTVQDNGQGRAAQIKALQSLQQLGQGGLNAQDRADLLQANNAAAQQNRGAQEAILSNQRARGVGGGGAELAARMAAQQAAANTASQNSNQIAANARQRALQAMQAAGITGSDLRNSDLNLASRNADIINAFNQANFVNKQQIANQNVANRNEAQGFNLSNAQNLSNSNVDTNNAFKQYNQQNQNALRQQTFSNDMAKLNGQAGAAGSAAQYQNANAAGQQAQNQGVGKALGSIAGYGLQNILGK